MARLARLTLGGYPHLVRLRTGTRPLLHDDVDAGRLLADLRVATGIAQVAIHGYALLPDALWLLATPADAGGLGRLLQALGRTYVRAYNQRHGGRGALFDGRYRAAVVEPGATFLAALHYVETQPVQSGRAAAPADYPWSSYRHHAGLGVDPTVRVHALVWALGNTPFERQAAHRVAVETAIAAADTERFDQALAGGWVVGTDDFVQRLAPMCSRRPRPGRPGRPRVHRRNAVNGTTDP
jgi:putative transposase